METYGADQSRANDYWDDRYGNTDRPEPEREKNTAVNYTEHPYLYGIAVSEPLTGSPDKWWLAELASIHLVPAAQRVLALGSGMARSEEYLLKAGYARHITAFEASEAACRAVQERIRGTELSGRLDMRSDDIFTADLPDASFDLVMVAAALHHFLKIEEIFALIHRVLKPGGLLLFDEYVGPDFHMFPPELMKLLNRVNAVIPSSLKWDHCARQQRIECPPPSLDWILSVDPTEGVHASRILPLAYQYFEFVERRNFGGTLVRPFFSCILPNFDFNNEKDRAIAGLVVLLEQELTGAGVLPHHNVIVLGRRREEPLSPLTAAQADRIAFTGWDLE